MMNVMLMVKVMMNFDLKWDNRGISFLDGFHHQFFSAKNQNLATKQIGDFWSLPEEWQTATAVQRALTIGRAESAAVINLLNKVSPKAVTFLEQSVKSRGMLKYLSVDVIGKDVLNRGWSSGSGTLEVWKEKLRNNSDDTLVAHMN